MRTTEQLEKDQHEVEAAVRAAGATRHLTEILAFSQDISSASDRTAVLREAAKTIARSLGAPLHTLSEVEEGRQLQRTVGGAHESTSSCSLDVTASADAYALAVKSPIRVDDLVAETRFRDEVLRGFGVLSGVCVRLSCGNSADCCIGAYDTHRRVVSEEIVNLAKIIASVASSALGRIAAEVRLDEVQSLASALLDSSSSLVLVLDEQLRIVRMNAVCQGVVGFTLEEVKGRAMSSVLVVPEEYDKVSMLLREAKTASDPIEFDSQILTKRGERRKVHWSLSAAHQSGGETSLVMTGTCHDELDADTQRALVDIGVKSVGQSASAPSDRPAADETTQAADWLSIAPYSGDVAPAEGDYFNAPYHEISAGGVTFQFSGKPDFDSLVIALGNPARPTLLTASVVRVQTMVQSGKIMYLVGCRFTGRLTRIEG